MSFDSKKFLKTKFVAREEKITVPELKDFFDEGESPVWTVRGLTGQELGACNEAEARNKNLLAIIDGFASQIPGEIAKAIKSLYGREEIPQDIAKRIEQLIIASAEPKVDLELANKLCKTFPIEFYIITNKIIELTGKGHIPGKVMPSGEIQTSEPH